ncbi:MAG: methylenetetrahydrofolate--tRNA-(uracil(54)-C(5))-methyltransferase (FADH(2)-oxidizing) TrmFO [Gemmatimonadetes bacterium]|nr:methylenetetrahydrofolate--tRNA-(uracil(54)-C(5))-methyltransferase (FADH(2)-oxidizing) TrmFO [Gemmatimonadota bacterium]
MTVTVVGGGLAGAEAAWALAERGMDVELHEMRPAVRTPAHQTGRLAELVCSNSFKSTDLGNAHGLLKDELRRLGSFLLPIADEARVPAGAALAVDREVFSQLAHERLAAHPRIRIVTGEVTALPSPGIIATGPLTSEALAHAILHALSASAEHVRSGRIYPAGTDVGERGSSGAALGEREATALAFYDAIAPIVSRESVDESVVYALSRYGKGDGDDYLNCPMTREEYEAFLAALTTADQFTAHEFDQVPYFEGCLPVEEMARRGPETLRFGPMKPVGLRDPRTGRDPHAVVQLRREDRAGQMWNLVGFQTRLRIPEQQRVFRMIPGLANAEFLRFGSIHRNSYLNSPAYLGPALTAPGDGTLFFAGQLTGVEGYTESLGTGLLAGINLARVRRGMEPAVPPPTTMLGALYRHLREADPRHFQPMNANFGLVEPLELPRKAPKDRKKELLVERARADFGAWLAGLT